MKKFTLQTSLLSIVSAFVFTIGYSQSANLDQIRNGPLGTYSPTPSADWVNGNAGPSNAHFAEGYSIPYRVRIDGLTGGTSQHHHLIIEWDTKQSNGHAIDYITHFQNLDNPTGSHHATFGHDPETIDPTLGTTFTSTTPVYFHIPAPSSAGSEVSGQPTTSFNNIGSTTNNGHIHDMTIWGGAIVTLTYVFEEAPDATTGSTQTRLDIEFTSTDGSTALIAWAGHIAAEYDWGATRGATGVSGSPYHTRIIEIDGKPGNQDRSLKATAVIIPPPVCGISAAQTVCASTTSLTYTAQGASTGSNISYQWSIQNPNTANAVIFGSSTGYSVDIHPSGATFTEGGTFSLSLVVTKVGATQTASCTQAPAGSIEKVVVAATASPTAFDLAVRNTSNLTSSVAGSTVTDVTKYSFLWVQDPASGGTLSTTTVQNPTFTATAAGTYTFTVTATETVAPYCSKSNKVVVTVASSSPNCGISGPTPVCPSSTNVYKYDPNNDGTADPIPTNFTAAWTLINNTNGAQFVSGSTTTGTSVSVVAAATCSTTYTVKITLTSTSGLITQACTKTVTVDDKTPPTITSCPPDVIIECGTSTATSNTGGTASATDNCSAIVTYNDVVQTGCMTIITRTWTATDPCGNTATCVQHITIRDRTAPIITCPSGSTGSATATDNCTPSGQITIFYRDNGTTRTWTAVDAAGNTSTCTQTITLSVVNKNPTPDQVEEPITKTPITKGPITKGPIIAPSGLVVNAFPNPYSNNIIFNFASPVSGHALLEAYDLIGRKVAVIFEGNVDAGVEKTVNYKIPALKRIPIVYRLNVGDKSAMGKLLPVQY
ncbi:MAG: hypothetical protein ACM3VS_12645 [Candidatus Dadabacteria bacterium]